MDIDKRNELEEEEHCIIDRLKELGYKNLEYWGGRVFDQRTDKNQSESMRWITIFYKKTTHKHSVNKC